MIKEILTAAGLTHAQGRFVRKPGGTYAVYFDDITSETADRGAAEAPPRIYHHDVTVEVYEPTPDDATEAAIEAELDARALPWTKQDRYWLKESQQYQVIYETNYTTKQRR